jgi:prephenate dehydratase
LLKHSDKVRIIGETVEKEVFCLCTYGNVALELICEVVSHPTILEDCSEYLDFLDGKHSSGQRIKRTLSITSATACISLVSMPDRSGVAVICSAEAAAYYGLTVLSHGIGNDRNSESRYIIVAQYGEAGSIDPLRICDITNGSDSYKATLSLSLKNIPGAMFRMTSCFAMRDLNIYKVETRPASTAIGLKGIPANSNRFVHWDLVFFIDYEPSDVTDVNENLIRNLGEYCLWVRPLGVYRQHGQGQTITEPSEWSQMVDILATA